MFVLTSKHFFPKADTWKRLLKKRFAVKKRFDVSPFLMDFCSPLSKETPSSSSWRLPRARQGAKRFDVSTFFLTTFRRRYFSALGRGRGRSVSTSRQTFPFRTCSKGSTWKRFRLVDTWKRFPAPKETFPRVGTWKRFRESP